MKEAVSVSIAAKAPRVKSLLPVRPHRTPSWFYTLWTWLCLWQRSRTNFFLCITFGSHTCSNRRAVRHICFCSILVKNTLSA